MSRALFAVVAVIAISGCKTERHELWTCPMHPQYVTDKPGDCPICSMKLVRKDALRPVLDAEHQRLMGVKLVTVVKAPLAPAIRTTGRITFDERRVRKVTARFEGYVEKLSADFTGKFVDKGAPLVSIYSPDLLATEEEFLLAVRSRAALAQSGLPDAARAAHDRLLLYGIAESEIARLEKSGKPERALTLYAPISGFITSKSVVAGSRVMPNDALFEIVDLSRVWVMADVYENELPRLKLGQNAALTLSYWPERRWIGRIAYILPTVDDKTRTVKVRVELDNPKGELKPEMFGDVTIDTAAREALVVPEDAVITTGLRKLVYVAPDLQPREIETGAHAGGMYEVVRGLSAGEQVATGAAFLLDSETHLRGSAP